MSEVPAYEELFSRNLGVFTPEQQERIRRLTVAIAGCGGLGGPVAYLLARLGVGELRLADPEVFEASNVNRQFGAYVDTIGVNKAEAMAAEARRINPHIVALTYPGGLDHGNVGGFLDGADALVDGLEFFEFELQLALHETARESGIWVFTAQAALEVYTQFAFDPQGPGLISALSCAPTIERAIRVFFPVLPAAATPEALARVAAGEMPHISSYAPAPAIGAGTVVEDMVRVLVRRQEPIATFPDTWAFDLASMTTRLVTRVMTDDGTVLDS